VIGKLPKPERDKIALYCFNVRMRNENKRNINRATPCADRGGMADNVQPPATSRDSHTGRVTVRRGIYSFAGVDVRGAK